MIFHHTEFLGAAEERVFRPIIKVSFSSDGKEVPMQCMIDSGSDYTILPIEAAGIFKFNLSDQPQYRMAGAGNNTFKIYKSPTELDIVLKRKGFREIKYKSFIYFAESEPIGLLGFKGFLENLKVKLDGKNKEIEIIQ
jgi:predicted aspartyl protease